MMMNRAFSRSTLLAMSLLGPGLGACGDDPAPVPAAPAEAPSSEAAAPGAADPLARPPDVVVVVIDTLRADHLSLYGHERDTSPHLDRLASSGLTFTRAYAQSGWTLASMATLLTGLYPHQHRVARDGCQPEAFGALDPARTTLAEALTARGYRAGAWVNNTFMAPVFGLNQGFSVYDYKGATNDDHRSAAATVDAAMAWLDSPPDPADAGKPAFLFVHFMEPHLDYVAPAPHRGRYSAGLPSGRVGKIPFAAFQTRQVRPTDEEKVYLEALYDEEIRAADEGLAALVAALEQRKRLENTLLVVTSDHGEEFWEHGGFEHGHALWSELTRVPLVVRGPGVPAGMRTNTVVEHVDLVQGLAARTGARLDPAAGGADIFGVAQGPPLPRAALSDNCLYGPSCVSLTDGEHRLVLRHELVFPEGQPPGQRPDLSKAQVRPRADVWAMDAEGMESRQLPAEEGQKLVPTLARMMEARRGTLAPLTARDGAAMPDFETFTMLKELGYVDRPDAAAQPQTPCQ
jgi:arylsulfatase A-like enzyme